MISEAMDLLGIDRVTAKDHPTGRPIIEINRMLLGTLRLEVQARASRGATVTAEDLRLAAAQEAQRPQALADLLAFIADEVADLPPEHDRLAAEIDGPSRAGPRSGP